MSGKTVLERRGVAPRHRAEQTGASHWAGWPAVRGAVALALLLAFGLMAPTGCRSAGGAAAPFVHGDDSPPPPPPVTPRPVGPRPAPVAHVAPVPALVVAPVPAVPVLAPPLLPSEAFAVPAAPALADTPRRPVPVLPGSVPAVPVLVD